MAVDIVQIGTVYDALSTKATGTMQTLFDSNEITSDDKGKVISNVIATVLQLSVKAVQDQPVQDAQVNMIEAQTVTEGSRKLLVDRQITGFDDNLRVEEAKQLANVTGMFGAGGTALPTNLETKMFDAVDAITP